jgi:hypothetical protein
VVQASAKFNADLFRALKGGLNNFGVVTRFDLSTFEQGRMWGGAVFYDRTAYSDLVQKFCDFVSNHTLDPNAHLIAASGFMLGVLTHTERVFSKRMYEERKIKAHIQDGNREWITLLA